MLRVNQQLGQPRELPLPLVAKLQQYLVHRGGKRPAAKPTGLQPVNIAQGKLPLIRRSCLHRPYSGTPCLGLVKIAVPVALGEFDGVDGARSASHGSDGHYGDVLRVQPQLPEERSLSRGDAMLPENDQVMEPAAQFLEG